MSIENIRAIKAAAGLPKAKKFKPIAKKSAKKLKQEVEHKELLKKDREFYIEVWNSSPHVCRECERKLGRILNTIFMHHLLPKAKYPAYRHTPENIVILCPDHHSQAEINIDKVPKVKQLTKEALNNCHKWNKD